jgi:hypothetical protein
MLAHIGGTRLNQEEFPITPDFAANQPDGTLGERGVDSAIEVDRRADSTLRGA